MSLRCINCSLGISRIRRHRLSEESDQIVEKLRMDISSRCFQAHMLETRCITMNRWVIEAVNGWLSRDFKTFRAEFFNKWCPHIMQEFYIAAALLNHFAVQFRERANVEAILDIIQAKIFEENQLGLIVQQNNLNMCHSMFHNMTRSTVTFPQLSIDDLKVIALGTYQIHQAKSYVGECLRFHGLYTIEGSRTEVDSQKLSAFNGIDPYILWAKIKSRYIGGKSYFT